MSKAAKDWLLALAASVIVLIVLVVGALVITAPVSVAISRHHAENEMRAAMLNVDTWAGLSAPAPKRDMRVAKREAADLHCLALNVYHEARGESWQGQVAVAEVTLVRAARRGGGACKEVFRPSQFSWTLDEAKSSYRPAPRSEPWQAAISAAKVAMMHEMAGLPPFSNGATHYHANYVRPTWAKQMTLVAVIGAHKFYRA